MNPDRTRNVKLQTARRYSYLWSLWKPEPSPGRYHYDQIRATLPPDHLEGRILDAGCGNGLDTERLARYSKSEVVAVDLSEEGVRQTRERTRSQGRVRVIRADLERLPLRDSQFHFVYSYGVLHHLVHPELGLRELVRVLKPGGRLAIYVYEDFEDRSAFERLLLKGVRLLRRGTVRIPPAWLFRICQILSPLIYLGLTVPAKLLAMHPRGEPLSRRIPYRHGRRPLGLAKDLYDRFAAPIEKRYSRAQVERWLKESGLLEVGVTRLRGWVGLGRAPLAGRGGSG